MREKMKRLIIQKSLIFLAATFLLVACNQSELSSSSIVNSTQPEQKSFKKDVIDSIVNNYKNEHQFMGSVTILKDGIPVYSYATGFSDYENKKNATIETKYRIGSISKTFTALLTLIAVEEGKLTLSQTLEKFHPKVPNASKITIEQMLNHRSGIPSYTGDPKFMEYVANGASIDEMMDIIVNYSSVFEPGSKESYSNSNYYLLTLILEHIYQQPYAKLIQEKISTPLSLTRSYYAERISGEKNEAYSYRNTSTVERAKEMSHSVMLGAGGIVSTPTDLAKLYHAIFNGKLINQESLKNMLTIEDTFGLGIQKLTYLGKESYGHRGKVDEFNSIVLYNPKEKISLAIIDNSSFSEMPNIAKEILSSYFGNQSIPITAEELEKFVGVYDSVDSEDETVFERQENRLILVIKGEFREELIYKGNNNFLFDQPYAPAITFMFSEDGNEFVFKQNSEFRYTKRQ